MPSAGRKAHSEAQRNNSKEPIQRHRNYNEHQYPTVNIQGHQGILHFAGLSPAADAPARSCKLSVRRSALPLLHSPSEEPVARDAWPAAHGIVARGLTGRPHVPAPLDTRGRPRRCWPRSRGSGCGRGRRAQLPARRAVAAGPRAAAAPPPWPPRAAAPAPGPAAAGVAAPSGKTVSRHRSTQERAGRRRKAGPRVPCARGPLLY